MNTTTQSITAGAAYAVAHADALDTLDRIREQLLSMPAPDGDRLQWGRVGSVVEVRRRLAEIATFLDG